MRMQNRGRITSSTNNEWIERANISRLHMSDVRKYITQVTHTHRERERQIK